MPHVPEHDGQQQGFFKGLSSVAQVASILAPLAGPFVQAQQQAPPALANVSGKAVLGLTPEQTQQTLGAIRNAASQDIVVRARERETVARQVENEKDRSAQLGLEQLRIKNREAEQKISEAGALDRAKLQVAGREKAATTLFERRDELAVKAEERFLDRPTAPKLPPTRFAEAVDDAGNPALVRINPDGSTEPVVFPDGFQPAAAPVGGKPPDPILTAGRFFDSIKKAEDAGANPTESAESFASFLEVSGIAPTSPLGQRLSGLYFEAQQDVEDAKAGGLLDVNAEDSALTVFFKTRAAMFIQDMNEKSLAGSLRRLGRDLAGKDPAVGERVVPGGAGL